MENQNIQQQQIQSNESLDSKNSSVVENALTDNNVESKEKLSFKDKISLKIAEWYAKILWKRSFILTKELEEDDQIVSVVQEVYKHPESRLSKIGDWILDDKMSFLFHAAYKHCQNNKVLICYRWTDFKNTKDLFSDVQIVLWVNGMDVRVKESIEFYDSVQMKYPESEKRICGHSLWGSISYVVNIHRSPKRCIVFNPGASPTKTFLWMMKDTLLKKERTKTITTYKILWDIISTLSFVWNVKTFILKSVSPLKLHSINSFPFLFEEEKKKNRT